MKVSSHLVTVSLFGQLVVSDVCSYFPIPFSVQYYQGSGATHHTIYPIQESVFIAHQYLLPVKCSIKKRKLQSIEDVSPLHRLQVKWLLQYATKIPQFMIELIISYFYKNVLNKILTPLKLSAGATELT